VLRSHVAIPCLVALAGIAVSAGGGAAAARELHAAGAAMHHGARHLAHHVAHHVADDEASPGGQNFSGFASYYSGSRRIVSSGTFNSSGYTCAHRTLPFGTRLRVVDPNSGRSVEVTVNDRGPFVHGRVLDLSLSAAKALGMIGRGVVRVDASVI